MVLALLLKGASASYLRGAFSGYSVVQGAALANGQSAGDFRRLQVEMAKNLAGSIEITDLQDLQKQLRQVAPELYYKFRRDIKRVGVPARDAVRDKFRGINLNGPLGAPKRPGRVFDKFATSEVGRLSWYNSKTLSQNKAIDVNYKNRNASKDFQKIKNGADGTLSIVRVRVMAPAYVVADMAGKTMSARTPDGGLSRQYQMDLFGRGRVTRRHRVNRDNVDNWIRRLNSEGGGDGKASRYAWPAMEKHAPKYRADTSKLLNTTISILNQRMTS